MADSTPKASPHQKHHENTLLLLGSLSQVSYHLFGLLLSVLGWVFTIISTTSEQWRMWDVINFPEVTPGRIKIGIWRVCSRSEESLEWHCHRLLSENMSLPIEIFAAQDLMTLACILQSAAITLMSFAFWTLSNHEKKRKLFLYFFNIGVILNLICAICILISTSWNIYSILQKEGIKFPENFQLPQLPNEQQVGFSIYMGYLGATCQLLNTLFNICDKVRRAKKIHPLIFVSVDASSNVQECPQCGSSTDISKLNIY